MMLHVLYVDIVVAVKLAFLSTMCPQSAGDARCFTGQASLFACLLRMDKRPGKTIHRA